MSYEKKRMKTLNASFESHTMTESAPVKSEGENSSLSPDIVQKALAVLATRVATLEKDAPTCKLFKT